MMWVGAYGLLLTKPGDPIDWLVLIRAAIVLGCLLVRFKPIVRAPRYQIALSWFSTFLPLAITARFAADVQGSVGLVFWIVGTSLALWACIDLGRSFGISPAVRPFVRTGIYRFVRNPMYVGHVVAEIGFLVAAPSVQNFLLCLTCWIFYGIRIRWESTLFQRSLLIAV